MRILSGRQDREWDGARGAFNVQFGRYRNDVKRQAEAQRLRYPGALDPSRWTISHAVVEATGRAVPSRAAYRIRGNAVRPLSAYQNDHLGRRHPDSI